ncbi:hypothetical protein AAG906_011549 [Vitis piasezkii]
MCLWSQRSKFLGFIVTQRGIEVNQDQIKPVMETSVPSCKKELQRLTGRLVALGRFIARFTNKLRFFFLILKGINVTGWTSDYELAFEEIKRYLTQPPILSSPQFGEQLYMYLAVYDCVDKEQKPVYYISKAMVDAETWYSKMGLSQEGVVDIARRWGLPREYEAKDEHIENVQVDALAGIAATLPIKKTILLSVYLQAASLIATTPICNTSETGVGWMHEIEMYLRTGDPLEESKQAHKVRIQAARFTLIGDNLYRWFYGGPYLKCLNDTEAQYVSAELHEGVCGNHIGGRTLAHRAHSQGYY